MGKIGKNGGYPIMIEVQDLWKEFHRHDALRGLTFTVPQGRVVKNHIHRGPVKVIDILYISI